MTEGSRRPQYVARRAYPVLFLGEPRLKRVYEGSASGKLLVQPFCGLDGADGLGQMGVGYFVIDPETDKRKGAWTWGLITPKNLIASYRAIRFMELLPEVRPNTLHQAFYLAARDDGREINQEERQRLIELVGGQESYEQTMRLVPPNGELEDVLLVLKEHDIEVATYPFVEEIEAGTMELTPFLSEIGVIHPDEIKRRQVKAQEITGRYWRYVRPYLREKGIKEQSMLGAEIGHSIVEGVLRGIQETDLLVGIAIVAGHHKISALVGSMLPLPGSGEIIESHRKKDIGEVADYLARQFSARYIPWWQKLASPVQRWRGKQPEPVVQTNRTPGEYEQLLLDLREKWNDMPQVVEL